MKSFKDKLETFENQFPDRDYLVEVEFPEFTSVCPKTGQPDFGTFYLEYIPDQKCIELKSLKIYLQEFRNEGIFYEHVTNFIFDDLVNSIEPRSASLTMLFNPRGGMTSEITVNYEKPDSDG